MASIFDETQRQSFHPRIDALDAGRTPAWGRFTAPAMVAHLIAALSAGLGELPIDAPRGPVSWYPMNVLVIHVLPWPAAKAKSPHEFLATLPGPWKEDIAKLHDLVDRTSRKGADSEWPLSPAFGKLSGKSWGVLQYRHVDHHLRQFRV